MANKAVDARVNDVLAALDLNTHQLRRKGVIGERAEERETAPEDQDASAYFAPQRQAGCPTEAHIQRRHNENSQPTHFYPDEDSHIGARFTAGAGHAQALGQQRRIPGAKPQENGGSEEDKPDTEDPALHPAPIARQP